MAHNFSVTVGWMQAGILVRDAASDVIASGNSGGHVVW